MRTARYFCLVAVATTSLLAGCMDRGDVGLGPACESNVVAAERALSHARANRIGKAIDWAKAATLIAAARTQQQFSEFQNCLLKAKKAREILGRYN